MKPGIKTTEFWAPVIATVLSLALYFTSNLLDGDHLSSTILAGILAAGASAGWWEYVKGRGYLKSGEQVKAAMEKNPELAANLLKMRGGKGRDFS